MSDDDEAEDSEGGGGRRRRISRGGEQRRLKRLRKASPPADTARARGSSVANAPKRRGSAAVHTQSNSEIRSRPSVGIENDAGRRYIFGRLLVIVREIFDEYAHQIEDNVKPEAKNTDQEESKEKEVKKEDDQVTAEKQPTLIVKELNDEGKALSDEKITNFVTELEKCMMETYAEPDKTGKPSAGPKYK